ncbi:hypothetical protein NLX83_11025 [Allokutzneria sp. A3M-2-11 16]|uniref:hypothetical protein n=1 Tax=Allokutzneria sp. A3M-2-11 16 TaxID=2962043 RepID=UPI0020B7AA4A|nr:hypothetical protein [Allokutzneria sp. A3M-2-11 16]MCP3799789.1 hypothetical protein [Allokutzneria sp. A3M-2-11 16]
MAGSRELGARVTRYETDNAKRSHLAFALLSVGVVFLVACVLPFPIPIASAILGLTCLWVGWRHARLAAKHPEEAFLLHEGGLVHEHSGQAHVYRWHELASATDNARDNAVTRLFGLNVNLRITLVGGGEIVVTGLTPGAAQLSEAVLRATR